jgi:hypothetical protein
MSEHKIERISRELRATAPPAPEAVRRDVVALTARAQQPERPHWLRWSNVRFPVHRVVAVVVVAFVALTVSATALRTLTRSGEDSPRTAVGRQTDRAGGVAGQAGSPERALEGQPFAPISPARRRHQDYDVELALRLRNSEAVSDATRRIVRETRRSGGYVVSSVVSTEENDTVGSVELRIPVRNAQRALARFTALGTILHQRVAFRDLQGLVDARAHDIAVQREIIRDLERALRGGLTPRARATAEQALIAARRRVSTFEGERRALVGQAAYAQFSLELTTREPVAADGDSGRLEQFFDDARAILEWELVAVLYALVVAGPLVLLVGLGLLVARARRRRSNDALLAHN